MAEIDAIIRSGKLAQGEYVARFEQAFASYIGTKYAVATNSGTTALQLALLAAGIKEGDEVITTPFSFIASANSILYCGARPVFVDIQPGTFNIDPNRIEAAITPNTKAILGVHLYGQAFDVEKVSELCEKHNLALIEDACQAHGAERNGKKVGSFGIGCFSFYPTKNMTTGEGGMITTDDEEVANKCRMLRNHGQQERYNHTMLGYNARMTEIAAAIGLKQLEKLDEFNARRISNAAALNPCIYMASGIAPPFVLPPNKHVFHQYTIRVTLGFKLKRDQLKQELEKRGIGCGVHYPIPIHHQPLYRELGYGDLQLMEAEKAAKEVLSLPVHPGLTQEDITKIHEAFECLRS